MAWIPGLQPHTVASDRCRPVLLAGVLLVVAAAGCHRSSGGGAGTGVTEEAGGLTYVKSFGAPGAEHRLHDTTATRDGGAVSVGRVETAQQSDGTFSRGIVVTRVDGAGDVVWSRTYGEFEAQDFELRRFGPAVPGPDGGAVIAGHSNEGPSLVRLDADGRFVWQRHYPQAARVTIHALTRTAGGNYVLAGDIQAGEDRFDAFVLATLGDGTQSAVLTDFDDSGDTSETIFAVRDGADGRLVVAGVRDGSDWLAELDAVSLVPLGIDRTGEGGGFDAVPVVDSQYVTAGVTGIAEDDGVVLASNPIGVVNGVDTEGFRKWFARLEDATEEDSPATALFGLARDPARGIVVAAGATLEADGRARTAHLIGVSEPAEPVLYPPALAISADFDIDFAPLLARTIAWDVTVTADGDYIVGGGFAVTLDDSQPLGADLEPWVARIDGDTHAFEWRVRLWRQAPGCTKRISPRAFSSMPGTTVHALADGTILFSSPTCVAKLAADGGVLWGATSAPADEDGRRILEAANGDLIIVGSRRGAEAEAQTPWVLRLDSDGNVLWSRLMHSIAGEPADGAATDVAEHDGELLVIGTAQAGGASWLARMSGEGGPPLLARLFPVNSDFSEPRIASRDGNVFAILGNSTVARLDGATLDVQWAREVARGSSLTPTASYTLGVGLRALAPLADGGVAVTGGSPFLQELTLENLETSVPFVARFDTDGVLEWAKLYATSRAVSINGAGTAIRTTTDGGLAVAVTSAYRDDPQGRCDTLAVFFDQLDIACSDMLLMRLDEAGTVAFARVYGTATSEAAHTLALTADNGFLMAGASDGFNFPRYSGFAVRTDADGRVSDACPAGLDEPAQLSEIDVDLQLAVAAAAGQRAEIFSSEPLVLSAANQIETARACSGISESPALVVTVIGDGAVTSEPAGIACGLGESDCEQAYARDTRVVLTAAPAEGATFTGWDGACAAFGVRADIDLTMIEPLACTARFTGDDGEPGDEPGDGGGSFSIRINMSPGGLAGDRVFSRPPNEGIDCSRGGETGCEAEFDAGTDVVVLEAVPGDGPTFITWGGVCLGVADGPVCPVSNPGTGELIEIGIHFQ